MISEAERALEEYRTSTYHQRLNIMTDFFEKVLPDLISTLKDKELMQGGRATKEAEIRAKGTA